MVNAGPRWKTCRWFFGFESEEQFRSWFYDDKFLSAAYERGAKLVVYSVAEEDIIRGNAQCIFRKHP